jgi:hypothetical protein
MIARVQALPASCFSIHCLLLIICLSYLSPRFLVTVCESLVCSMVQVMRLDLIKHAALNDLRDVGTVS